VLQVIPTQQTTFQAAKYDIVEQPQLLHSVFAWLKDAGSMFMAGRRQVDRYFSNSSWNVLFIPCVVHMFTDRAPTVQQDKKLGIQLLKMADVGLLRII
jgi:hypothetical protein